MRQTMALSWMVMLLIGAFSALAATMTTTSPSGSYVLYDPIGSLSWSSASSSAYDVPSPLSSTSLVLDKYQKANVNNRMGELLVRLGEEHFKNEVLKQVVRESMFTRTSMIVAMLNDNLVLWDQNLGEVYNGNHVQLIQTTANCAQGSVCFTAKMYGMSGDVIQTRTVTIFPPGGGASIVVLGGDSG